MNYERKQNQCAYLTLSGVILPMSENWHQKVVQHIIEQYGKPILILAFDSLLMYKVK